jgi:hypothetical protein
MKQTVFVLSLLLFSSATLAQKVKYSGDWILNEDKSELGHEYSLAPASISIKQTRKLLVMKTTHHWNEEIYVSEQRFTLDGEACENAGFENSTTLSSAELDRESKTIKIVTQGNAEGLDYTFTQDISLRDGHLVVNARAETALGELLETFVFDKQ